MSIPLSQTTSTLSPPPLCPQDRHHKNTQTINAGEGVEKTEPSCTLGGVDWYSQYGEVLRFLKKLIIEHMTTYDNPTTGHIPRQNHKSQWHAPQCSVQLFTIARTQKQPKCPKFIHIYQDSTHLFNTATEYLPPGSKLPVAQNTEMSNVQSLTSWISFLQGWIGNEERLDYLIL